MIQFEGAMTAIVTPMHEDRSVDFEVLRDFTEWQISRGIHGLVPCGTTGEGATLTDDEHKAVIEAVVQASAGRVPVIAGCGSNDTKRTVCAAARAAAAGADALLVVTPYYNKPNRSGMRAHFESVASATELPIVAYNVPGRTGQNLGADGILELSRIPTVAAVKEASADLEQIATVLADRPSGFAVLSGDDSLVLPTMALGAEGVISVASNEAPAEMAALVVAARSGDLVRARSLHYRLLPLMRANFIESNPVPVKAAVASLGFGGAWARPPLGPAEPSTLEALRSAIRQARLEGR